MYRLSLPDMRWNATGRTNGEDESNQGGLIFKSDYELQSDAPSLIRRVWNSVTHQNRILL